MENLHKNIGKRLKEIRTVFYNGNKLSVRLFAETVGEPQDNITNYENGRAGVPNRLLVKLYNLGYSPVYLLTGDGGIYADNEAGAELLKASGYDIGDSVGSRAEAEELEAKAIALRAAAGDILSMIKKKKRQKKL